MCMAMKMKSSARYEKRIPAIAAHHNGQQAKVIIRQSPCPIIRFSMAKIIIAIIIGEEIEILTPRVLMGMARVMRMKPRLAHWERYSPNIGAPARNTPE